MAIDKIKFLLGQGEEIEFNGSELLANRSDDYEIIIALWANRLYCQTQTMRKMSVFTRLCKEDIYQIIIRMGDREVVYGQGSKGCRVTVDMDWNLVIMFPGYTETERTLIKKGEK